MESIVVSIVTGVCSIIGVESYARFAYKTILIKSR